MSSLRKFRKKCKELILGEIATHWRIKGVAMADGAIAPHLGGFGEKILRKNKQKRKKKRPFGNEVDEI